MNTLKKNITIDTKLNSWVNNINENELNQVCNRYLKLGYITSTLCQTTINPENTIFKNINCQVKNSLNDIENKNNLQMKIMETKISENLDRVKNSIEKLTASNSKSILKGNLGENLIESIVCNNFPDDTLINMSKVTGAGDYHLHLNNKQIIMIEVKKYKGCVPKKEIDKFKRDMRKHGHKIGIFISLDSSIISKKRFEIESINDKQKIIYIPNSGIDGIAIIWAILMAKEIMNLNSQPLSLNQQKIMEIYDNFELIYKKFCKIKFSIQDSKDIIEKQMNKLNQEALELDITIYTLLKNTSNIIKNELHFCDTFLQQVNYDECHAIIEEMNRNGDKRVFIHSEILSLCIKNKYKIKFSIDDKLRWIIYDQEGIKEIIRFKLNKTKVDLLIEESNVTVVGNKKGIKYLEKIL